MNASAIEVYEIFKENLKLGEEKASMVIKYLENSTAEKIAIEIKSKIAHLATKDDVNDLKDDITAVREDMLKLEVSLKDDINQLRTETKEDMLKLEGSLKEDITAVREDMLKLEGSLKNDINQLRTETKEDMLKLEGSLKDDVNTVREEVLKLESSISKKHFDIIKWMFIFWVGTVGAIISAMIAIIKYLV